MQPKDADIQQYAESLVALSGAVDAQKRIEGELAGVVELLKTNEDVVRFISDPAVTDEGKARGLEEALSGKVHPALLHFILILHVQGALSELDAVAHVFFDRISESEQSADGTVVVARPISRKKLAVMEKETGALLGKKVRLRVTVDSNMLGGAVVRVGDFILDGSTERQLEDIRRSLLS
ncbi:ATP synthase F1 subunit delta [Verrucomicrobiota bacterium]